MVRHSAHRSSRCSTAPIIPRVSCARPRVLSPALLTAMSRLASLFVHPITHSHLPGPLTSVINCATALFFLTYACALSALLLVLCAPSPWPIPPLTAALQRRSLHIALWQFRYVLPEPSPCAPFPDFSFAPPLISYFLFILVIHVVHAS
jgi:hypothetical protein